MADQKLCEKLWDELTDLKELRLQIGRAIKTAKADKDFIACKYLRQKIREILDGPESEIGKFRKINLPPELRKLELKEQYESQLQVAWKSGLFGKSSPEKPLNAQGSGTKSLNGILKRIFKGKNLPSQPQEQAIKSLPEIKRNNQNYPMPTWPEVVTALKKNKEIIKGKSAQGFTKMLIVPFGYDLRKMASKFNEKVMELNREGINPDGSSNPEKGIFGAGGEKVNFHKEDIQYPYPVGVSNAWYESQLVYYPQKYDQINHGGLSKDDAIKINGAWQICFMEDLPVIPREGQKIGGRKQMDRKGSFINVQTKPPKIQEYKEALDKKQTIINPEKYKHESVIMPEKWLWMQFTSLLGNEKPVLMDYEKDIFRGTYFVDCFNTKSLETLTAFWGRAALKQVHMIFLGGQKPNNNPFGDEPGEDYMGIRTSVDIK